MAMTKEQFIERALARSTHALDYWANVARMVGKKSGIGISNRKEYSQRQWNWLQQVKPNLQKPWD